MTQLSWQSVKKHWPVVKEILVWGPIFSIPVLGVVVIVYIAFGWEKDGLFFDTLFALSMTGIVTFFLFLSLETAGVVPQGYFLGLAYEPESGQAGNAPGAAQPAPADFPPVPKWRPDFAPPIAQIAERAAFYTLGIRDIVIFRHGTCAIVAPGLPEEALVQRGKDILRDILHAHPDMTIMEMDDGNLLVRYTEPAVNVVLVAFARTHWAKIERHYRDALPASEVLLGPEGAGTFDDAEKMALYGRCFMFMDAQDPQVARIVRATASQGGQGKGPAFEGPAPKFVH